MSDDVDVEKSEEVLDPRIKDELDALNTASDSINKLENEVQRARVGFRALKAEYTDLLNQCVAKIGKRFIIKAKPYYDLLKNLQKLQLETQRVTAKYQKANSIYKAAQETVTLAEEQLVGEDGAKLAFDAAWQEMLNHANRRFMDAENEKRICEEDHQKCSKEFESMQRKIAIMHKDLNRAISKSRPFYEMRKKFESKLQAERQNAEDLQLALMCSKQKYSMALRGLERISEEIHAQRKVDLPERTPGVGAESDTCSDLSDLQSINFGDFLSETSSQVSRDDLADFDSDFGFDDEWAENITKSLVNSTLLSEETSIFSDNNNKSNVNSRNSVDGFFNRLSNRFNRSNSLGHITDPNNQKLSLPVKTSKDDLYQDQNDAGLVMNCSRDNTVEGAEKVEDVNDLPQDSTSNSDSLTSSSHSHFFTTNNKFTSAAYIVMSAPIDKCKRMTDGSTVSSTSTIKDSKSLISHKSHQQSFKQQQQHVTIPNIDTEPLQQLPIQQSHAHPQQIRPHQQDQPLISQNNEQQQQLEQKNSNNTHLQSSLNQPSDYSFPIIALDKVNHINTIQHHESSSSLSSLSDHQNHPNKRPPTHHIINKKHDSLPHSQMLNKEKLMSIDKRVDHHLGYIPDISSIENHQVIKTSGEHDHHRKDEGHKGGGKKCCNTEVFV